MALGGHLLDRRHVQATEGELAALPGMGAAEARHGRGQRHQRSPAA